MVTRHDVVLSGGRVVDPGSHLDEITDVGVIGCRVAEVGRDLDGRVVLDAGGCVVAPGFVDLHSHVHSIDGQRLQAFDGVTTALDLESGAAPTEVAYAAAAEEGRPLHYGFSASWAAVRMSVLAGWEPDGLMASMLSHIGDHRWQRAAARHEQATMIAELRAELEKGALGIGIIIGYAGAADPSEYLAVAALAAEAGVPTYTHARDLIEINPGTRIDGAHEVVRAAAESGAHMHYCHLNSTSLRHIDRVLGLVERVRSEGSVVTTEAYPYGAGMTGIGSEFLHPDRLRARGITPSSLVFAPTGERVANEARLRHLRDTDPGGLALVEFFDETDAADRELLQRTLLSPGTCIATDAVPLTWRGAPEPGTWPLPPSASTHPRTAGTFAKAFRWSVAETGTVDIPEFVRRASLLPAGVVVAATGGGVRKGTLEVGAVADVVVFDPTTFRDQATYEASTRPSTGVRHLVVAGTSVIRDGVLELEALPGMAVRSTPR